STQAGWHAGPFIHRSIQHLIDTYAPGNGGCTYLGWSEFIGRKQIVKKKEQEKKTLMVDEGQLEVLYRFYLGTPISQYGYDNRLGKQTFAQAQREIGDASAQ
ncbi:hypothetical protein, partial [Curtobacterium sp. MMLR14_002]|uniref:hypothetical protein n=1 Tax=Curtobacterium sp. MMLR14_002 TaxID=1898741 RepID=UPI001495DDDA